MFLFLTQQHDKDIIRKKESEEVDEKRMKSDKDKKVNGFSLYYLKKYISGIFVFEN